MRNHKLIFLVLALLGAVWQMARPRPFLVLIGERKLELAADQTGLRQLTGMIEKERVAGDRCLENLLGIDEPVSEGDVRWVYDPSCPFAQVEGAHKGYLALPNLDLEKELLDLAGHQHLLGEYRRALVRLEQACPPGVTVLEPLPRRRQQLLLQCRQYWTRALDIHRHNLANQATPGYRCQGLTLQGGYLRLGLGALKPDGKPFHLALDDNGKGFFVIQTGDGLEYTRDGGFYRRYDGQLSSFGGGRVLGTNGPIFVPETGGWIDDEGRLSDGGRLRVARPLDPQKLQPVQNGHFLCAECESSADYRVKAAAWSSPTSTPGGSSTGWNASPACLRRRSEFCRRTGSPSGDAET